jgi:hypothetical protein
MRKFQQLRNAFSDENSPLCAPFTKSIYTAVIVALLALAVPSLWAQSPGFVGYVLNSTEGTVTVFGAESDANIGNNDHAIATVTVGANPERIAVTPDGLYAFVSSPGDNSVWQIDMNDPTNPKPSKVTTFSNLGTPGGIAVTTFTNGGGTLFYLVWVADSTNCIMHVLNSQFGYQDSPQPLTPPASISSNATASCASSPIVTIPAVIATPDQTTAVFAAFNDVQFTDSTTTPPTVIPPAPYIYSFNPASATNFALSFAFTLLEPSSLSTMQDPNGNILLFIGEDGIDKGGVVLVSGISPTTLSAVSPEQQITEYPGTTQPTSITTNNLDRLQGITDSRTDVSFYLFVGDSSQGVGVYSVDCGSPSSPSIACTSELTVNRITTLTLSGVPTGIAAVPSSYEGDGRASIIYVTDPSTKGMELVLGEGPTGFPTPCVVGTKGCGGTTVAGGQVYDTAVTVGKVPVGASFGPISLQSRIIAWFTGYSLTGGGPFTPLSGASTFHPNVGTPYSNIEVQALGMVSTLQGGPTWLGTPTVQAAEGYTSGATCSGLGGSPCPAPEGPGVQTATVALGPVLEAVSRSSSAAIPQQSGSSPTVQDGDVTTIIFGGSTNLTSCPPGMTGCSYAQNITAKAQASCNLQVFVDGIAPSTSAITAYAGIDVNITASLSCKGAPSDLITGYISWGDGTTTIQNPPSIDFQMPMDGSNTSSPTFSKPVYATSVGSPFTISFVGMDSTGNYTITPNTFQVVVQPTYIVSGTISGPCANGTILTLTPMQGGTLTFPPATSQFGSYSFPSVPNGTYTISPSQAGCAFTPPPPVGANVVTVNGAPVTLDFSSTSIATFSISGSITGAVQNGVSITLTGPSNQTQSTSGGNYTFTGLPNGGPYTVTPKLIGYTFSPANYTGVNISGANVTGLNFTSVALLACTFQPFNPPSVPTGRQVTATLVCQGHPGDSLNGSITNWGDGSQSTAIPALVGGSGTATFTFTHIYLDPSPSGTPYTIVASVSDATTPTIPSATASTTLSVTATPINPEITISPSVSAQCTSTSSSITCMVGPGASVHLILGLDGHAEDAGLVFAITCEGLPQGSTCSYSPNPFTLNANGVQQGVLTISTTGPSSIAANTARELRDTRLLASLVSLPWLIGLFLTGLCTDRNKSPKRAYALFFVFFVILLVGGCGTSVNQSTLACPSCTPAGTSTVKVLAASQHPALQSSVTLQLQVSSGSQ